MASVVAAGLAGFVFGSFLPYYVGLKHGERILGVGGRFFFASEKELDKVEAWFERYGDRAVMIGRVIPVVRDFISLPAGYVRMSLFRFIVYTIVGSFPWIFGATLVGYLLEGEWNTILDGIEKGNRWILIFIGVTLCLLIIRSVWLRRRRFQS